VATVGQDVVAVTFSPLTGVTDSNGRFAFTAVELNDIQQSYQFQFSVIASATLNGKPTSGSGTGTVYILGVGSLVKVQPPSVPNDQRLPVGRVPFTAEQKAKFAELAVEFSLHAAQGFGQDLGLFLHGPTSQGVLLAIEKNLPSQTVALWDNFDIFLGPALFPLAIASAATTFLHVEYAKFLLALAEDPPDPNFTRVALPSVQVPPAITMTGGPFSANTTKLMNQSLSVKAVTQAYLAALLTSVNRYSTAITASLNFRGKA
jgi:hypothetical protein